MTTPPSLSAPLVQARIADMQRGVAGRRTARVPASRPGLLARLRRPGRPPVLPVPGDGAARVR